MFSSLFSLHRGLWWFIIIIVVVIVVLGDGINLDQFGGCFLLCWIFVAVLDPCVFVFYQWCLLIGCLCFGFLLASFSRLSPCFALSCFSSSASFLNILFRLPAFPLQMAICTRARGEKVSSTCFCLTFSSSSLS